MKPTQTQITLADARNRLSDVARESRSLHTSALTLRGWIEAERPKVVVAASLFISGFSGHVANTLIDAHILAEHAGRPIAGCIAVLETIEASADYKAAVSVIEPLLAEIAALEEKDVAERLEYSGKVAAHAAAVEAARAKALAKAESDPAVIAAAKALGI